MVGFAVEALRHAGKADVGIARHQPVAAVGTALGADALEVGLRHDHGAGLRIQRLLQVERIGQEREFAGRSLVKGSQANDRQVGITHNLRAVLGGELTQCGCLHGGTSLKNETATNERAPLTCCRR
ncbi:hypothetical protein D3C81_919180 [compost metagenome]